MRRLLLAGLCLASTGRAATYDPQLTWRTLTTAHFNLHFHQGEEQLAEELSSTVERVYDTMTVELAWQPRRRTEVVLVDRTDSANGMAGVVPYNAIVIYVTAPGADATLSLYEDWPEAIFTHELTHVLHMDTQHELVRLARTVVGRIATTNSLSPRWIVEGLATFEETRHTSGGRGRAPMVDMIKRTAVIEGPFPPLGNLDGIQAVPPGGNLRYLFGQDLIQYVADTRGEHVWTDWSHTYGSGLPYLLPSRRVFGARMAPLYREWRASLEHKYTAQLAPVEAEGIREGRRVSDDAASCTAPAFSPSGDHLVWSCTDPRTGSSIWLADGEGYAPEELLHDRGASSFTWRADSQALVYAGLHIVNRFNVWSDVWMVNLGDNPDHPVAGQVTALTSAKRARDPEFSPDGSKLWVVTNRVEDNNLAVITVDQRLTPLTAFTDHTQIATPRFHPDGEHVVASVWRDGRRDLWILDTDGTFVRRLTADAALDIQPRWSADGRWLFFSSDRTGIPNIYAIEVSTERLFQVTNVRTGATHPAPHPDGKSLAYAQYTQEGWEVRVLALDPSLWLDRGVLPAPIAGAPPLSTLAHPIDEPVAVNPDVPQWRGTPTRWRPGAPIQPPVGLTQSPSESIDTYDQLDAKDLFGEEVDFPFTITPHRYNPLPMLIPRFAAPYIQSTPYRPTRYGVVPIGWQASLGTSAGDVLGRYQYSASLFYRNDADFLGGAVSAAVTRFLPVYSVSAAHFTVPFAVFVPNLLRIGTDGRPQLRVAEDPYWEVRDQITAQVTYPYRPRTAVFARYTFLRRAAKSGVPGSAYLPAVPVHGTIGRLSAGWRYAWSQPTRLAISPEDGRVVSVVGSVLHPWLGSQLRDAADQVEPLTQLQVTGELREYLVNPWVPNHVLAMRFAGGTTLGATPFLGNYQLGGTFGDGGLSNTPDTFRMVRGYPIAAAVGDKYWLSSAEYRFPVWRIDRGFGALPAFLRYASGHVYVDAGNAATQVHSASDILKGSLVGVGAEIRLSAFLGWAQGVTGRVGYGVALTRGGYRLGDARGAYLRLGGSF